MRMGTVGALFALQGAIAFGVPAAASGQKDVVLTAHEIGRWCAGLPSFDPQVHGIIAGVITTEGGGADGVPLVWRRVAQGSAGDSLRAVSADGGLYVLCEVPAGADGIISTTDGWTGSALAPSVAAGAVRHVDLTAGAASADGTALYGYVKDGESGGPVVDAEVILGQGDRRAITNARGFFAFEEIMPGQSPLSVRRFGYVDREMVIDVRPSQASRVVVGLTADAIDLDPIEVDVRMGRRARQMREFERRREIAFGRFYVQEELLARNPGRMADLLRDLGVRVRQNGTFGGVEVEMRGRSCRPAVWIDGRLQAHRDGELWMAELRPLDVEAVEMYKAGATPAEFLVPPKSGGCVVMVIWTRR